MRGFILRLAGAATLDPATYEEVEQDRAASGQAVVVIGLAAVAAGFGALGWNASLTDVVSFAAAAGWVALVTWIAWAIMALEIGGHLFPEPQTRVDVGELLRTIGFSASPGLFLVFGIVPGLTTFVFGLTACWLLATMVLAVRQALDYTTVGRAVAVCAVGWLLAFAFILVLGVMFGPAVAH